MATKNHEATAVNSSSSPSQIASAIENHKELCEHCRRHPKYIDPHTKQLYPYCGRTCAQLAMVAKQREEFSSESSAASPITTPTTHGGFCEVCGAKRKYVDSDGFTHPYCGKNCANQRLQKPLPSPPLVPSEDTNLAPEVLEDHEAETNAAPLSKQGPSPILFYHRDAPHYGFTNFSDHPVEYMNRIYPTSEHLFQAFKFLKHHPDIADRVRTSERPRDAFNEAHKFQSKVRSDWTEVSISKMDKVLSLKFQQHRNLREELLDTGESELVEDSDVDEFWGIGADKSGRNELGKALMRLRRQLIVSAIEKRGANL